MRDKVTGADNQQETNTGVVQLVGSSETIRRAPFITKKILQSYLFGAMHDGWIRKSDQRYRIAQKGTGWLKIIQRLLSDFEYRSWIYREGKTRDVYVLESVASIFREDFDPNELMAIEEKRAYIRGFFDAEGGIPHSLDSVRYIQLTQKDKQKIMMLKIWLNEFDITTGKIHNPSKRIDPNYWRIFVSKGSIIPFTQQIGSWHPRKSAMFKKWRRYSPRPMAT